MLDDLFSFKALFNTTATDISTLERLSPANGFCLKSCIAGMIGMLTFMFGKIDVVFKALVIFIVLDYIFGLSVAIIKREVSSDIGRRGIIRKACFLLTVMVGVWLDKFLNSGEICKRSIITVLVLNEVSSILEKLEFLGVRIPLIRNLLKVTKSNKKCHLK